MMIPIVNLKMLDHRFDPSINYQLIIKPTGEMAVGPPIIVLHMAPICSPTLGNVLLQNKILNLEIMKTIIIFGKIPTTFTCHDFNIGASMESKR